jgi:hypothetical protein
MMPVSKCWQLMTKKKNNSEGIMKKIITLLLIILAFSLSANLEDCVISVSSGNVNAGDSITIAVSTSELNIDYDVISFQFEMFFDPYVVTYSSFEEGDIFTNGMLIMNEMQPGVLRAAYSHYIAQEGSGIICRINFFGISGDTVLDIHDFKYNATPINNTNNGSISVSGENLLPVAVAGEDVTVEEGDIVYLDGTASYDPEGNDLTYLWDAPPPISIENPASATTSFIAPLVEENTAYTITLVVNDGIHNSFPAEKIVIVENVSSNEETPAQITHVDIRSISPNPFNPATSINFSVPQGESQMKLNIYSIRGQLIRSFQLTGLSPNSLASVTWDGKDNSGNAVASGIYLCQVSGITSSAHSRMLLLK